MSNEIAGTGKSARVHGSDAVHSGGKLLAEAGDIKLIPLVDSFKQIEHTDTKALGPRHPVRKIYEQVSPAVIRTEVPYGRIKVPDANGQPIEVDGCYIGSGYFIDNNGRIATVAHTIEQATQDHMLNVVDAAGKYHPAKIEKVDFLNDLAVIKIDKTPPNVKPLTIGDSDRLQSNQPIYFLGHPHGFAATFISTGHYHHSESRLRIGDRDHIANFPWLGFAQSRISYVKSHVEHGNSGSPMVDGNGVVVGTMSSQEADRTKPSTGSVPTQELKDLIATTDPIYQVHSASIGHQYWRSYENLWKHDPILALGQTAAAAVAIGVLSRARILPVTGIAMGVLGGIIGVADGCTMLRERNPERKAVHQGSLLLDLLVAGGGLHGGLKSYCKGTGRLALALSAASLIGRSALEYLPKFRYNESSV